MILYGQKRGTRLSRRCLEREVLLILGQTNHTIVKLSSHCAESRLLIVFFKPGEVFYSYWNNVIKILFYLQKT